MLNEESEMYDILEINFSKEGYFVFKSEFYLNNKELEHEEVDVLAIKWGSEKLLDVFGVECKLKGSAKRSTLFSVQQALEYQTSLPAVYICSEKGDIGHLTNVLVNLNVGHYTIDNRKKVEKQISAKKGELFDFDFFHNYIKDRLIILLAFQGLFGAKKFRYGGFRDRGWVAKEFDNYLQFNCYYDGEDGIYSGFNLERKEGFRISYDKFDDGFFELIKQLPKDYIFGYGSYKRIPKSEEDGWIDEPNDVKIRNLKKEDFNYRKKLIKKALKRKDPNEKLQIYVSKKLWSTKQHLSREEYLAKIKESYDEIIPLVEYLVD